MTCSYWDSAKAAFDDGKVDEAYCPKFHLVRDDSDAEAEWRSCGDCNAMFDNSAAMDRHMFRSGHQRPERAVELVKSGAVTSAAQLTTE